MHGSWPRTFRGLELQMRSSPTSRSPRIEVAACPLGADIRFAPTWEMVISVDSTPSPKRSSIPLARAVEETRQIMTQAWE